MSSNFTFSEFKKQFYDDDICLEEIKKLRFPKGILCTSCREITMHYKISRRAAYACKECRRQIYPLSGTMFEKSTTPLHLWFFAMYLMTQTRANISVKQLQRELGVTYKTAWRMYARIKIKMEENNGDLLAREGKNKILKWVFFNTLELKVVQKGDSK